MNHSSSKIVSNTFIFTGTLIIQKVVSFLYFWFLSNQLSPNLLGTYIWALSLTGVFSIGVDLGLSPLLIREAARNPEKSEKLLRSVLTLKLIFTIITLTLLLTVLFISKRDILTTYVVLIGCAVMIFDSFTMSFYSFLRSQQNIKFESIGMLSVQILVFIFGAFLLNIDKNPMYAMIVLALGSGVNLIYAWFVVKFRYKIHTLPIFSREDAKLLLHLIPAFAFAGIFVRIYNVADSVMLGYFANETAVGLYSVPAKVVTALQMLIPGAFIASIYPAMSYYFKSDQNTLKRIFERSLGYLLIIVIPITFGISSLIPIILTTVWPAYIAIKSTFILMTLGLPFLFLTFPTGYLLNACGKESKNTKNRGIITVVNIVLNLILIPQFGVFGAGVAFLSANVLLLILDLYEVRKIIPIYTKWLFITFIKSVLAGLIMFFVIYLIRSSTPLILIVLSGLVVYLLLIFIFKIISKEEINFVRNLLTSKKDAVVIDV